MVNDIFMMLFRMAIIQLASRRFVCLLPVWHVLDIMSQLRNT